MAVKRHKGRKDYFKRAVRGHAARLAAPPDNRDKPVIQAPPDRLSDNAAKELFDESQPTDKHAARVMLVITLLCLAFIVFIAWCVTRMPEKPI
jgi:hypothetical protein